MDLVIARVSKKTVVEFDLVYPTKLTVLAFDIRLADTLDDLRIVLGK